MTYRGPNISHYLANLNAINPSQSSPESFDDSSFPDDDLALFASAQFFDFEMGQSVGNEEDQALKQRKEPVKSDTDLGFLEGLNDFGFDYPNLLPVLPNDPFAQQLSLPASPRQQQFQHQIRPSPAQRHTFIQPQPLTIQTQPQPQPILPHPNTSSISSPTSQTPTTTQQQQAFTSTLPPYLKRKASLLDYSASTSNSPTAESPSAGNGDDSSRNVADEDKRRRNTAASARFRIKKKQREQALEGHAKELESKCQTLQEKVNQLEMENKWLKNLITDKKEDSKKQVDQSTGSSTSAGRKGVGAVDA